MSKKSKCPKCNSEDLKSISILNLVLCTECEEEHFVAIT